MAVHPGGRRAKTAGDAAAQDRAELARIAARLGITPERVMQEWALIAFADIARIAEWGPGWFRMKDSEQLAKEDSAAISEVVAGGKAASRVKLFDKKAALDALARHIGMYEQAAAEGREIVSEDPRELIVRRLAAIVAGRTAKRPDPAAAAAGGDPVSASLGGMGAA